MPNDKCAVIKLIGPPERFFITWLDSIPSSYRKSLTTSTVMDEASVREQLLRMGKSSAQIAELIRAARNDARQRTLR